MYDKSKNKYFVSFNPMLGDIYLIASLTGESNERLSSIFISHSENEKILLERSRAAYGTATSQLVNYHQCCKAFWFRDYTTVMKCCETYDNIHQTSRKRLIRITDICNSFYGGLAMFILSRKFKEQKLIADGETHLLAMKIWETTCKWNFENKSMLLEAECHYAKGDNANAMVAYAKSIASARDHNFIHEEALAEELFGIFYIENGEVRKGSELIKHARDLYIQWGAHKKASLLYYPSSI